MKGNAVNICDDFEIRIHVKGAKYLATPVGANAVGHPPDALLPVTKQTAS